MAAAGALFAGGGLVLAISGGNAFLGGGACCVLVSVAVMGFHYLFWARWLGPKLKAELESERDDAPH